MAGAVTGCGAAEQSPDGSCSACVSPADLLSSWQLRSGEADLLGSCEQELVMSHVVLDTALLPVRSHCDCWD